MDQLVCMFLLFVGLFLEESEEAFSRDQILLEVSRHLQVDQRSLQLEVDLILQAAIRLRLERVVIFVEHTLFFSSELSSC